MTDVSLGFRWLAPAKTAAHGPWPGSIGSGAGDMRIAAVLIAAVALGRSTAKRHKRRP